MMSYMLILKFDLNLYVLNSIRKQIINNNVSQENGELLIDLSKIYFQGQINLNVFLAF